MVLSISSNIESNLSATLVISPDILLSLLTSSTTLVPLEVFHAFPYNLTFELTVYDVPGEYPLVAPEVVDHALLVYPEFGVIDDKVFSMI